MNSLYIAKNLIERTVQGKKGLIIYLLFPTLVISLFIGLMGKETSNIANIYYANSDSGILGEYLLTNLTSNSNYQLSLVDNANQVKENVIAGEAQAAFVIPKNFTEHLIAGQPGRIDMYQLNVNEASFTLKLHIDQAVQHIQQSIQIVQNQDPNAEISMNQLKELLEQQEKQLVRAEITDYELYVNPALYLVTGFLLMFIMGLVSSSVSIMIEDRKQKTMTRIYTAPVRAYEIALGNFIGSMALGIMQILGVLVLTKYVLGFDYGVPFVAHFFVLTGFLLATMGIASAVAGLVRNTTNVASINSLIITPTCMIGGCFWPIEIMPDFLQKMANFVPQKWAIDAVTRMSGGEALVQVGMNIAILGLFAVILLAFGTAVLKPSENQVN